MAAANLRMANLRGANLRSVRLVGAALIKANLEGAILDDADLEGANLEGANLAKAKLSAVNLRLANLKNANLEAAHLMGSSLIKANLEGANLEASDLSSANLEGAVLTRARLTAANLRMTNLSKVDLHGASLVGTILDENWREGSEAMPTHGFAGAITSVQLTDLIQLLCLSHANILVRVKSKQGDGSIYVRAGRVRHAQTGMVKGEEAFFQMLQWESGRFETLPLPEDETTTIDKPLEHLIIESIRLRDETESRERQEIDKRLVHELERHLPISANPAKGLIDLVAKEGKQIDADKEVTITGVYDSTDTGQIECTVSIDEGDVFFVPLTYVKFKKDHPLLPMIQQYEHELKQI
jgi:hypothetical protein